MNNYKKKVKNDEEIDKCYVSEDFQSTQKALFIMKKGYEVQKKSVVSNLSRYFREDYSLNDELLPLILNSIEAWDAEFQLLFAQSLGRTAREHHDKQWITPRNLKKAIEISLEFIDNLNPENEDIYEAWSDTFPRLAYQLNLISDSETEEVSKEF